MVFSWFSPFTVHEELPDKIGTMFIRFPAVNKQWIRYPGSTLVIKSGFVHMKAFPVQTSVLRLVSGLSNCP
jgi:hypothetical protein